MAILISGYAFAFPFPFSNTGPKLDKSASIFGIVIGPSGINQPGAIYVPIEGASVNLSGQKGAFTATTGKEGGYQIQKVPAGEYCLFVSKPGYDTFVAKMTVADLELKRVENITLIPGAGFSKSKGGISPNMAYVALAKSQPDQNINWTIFGEINRIKYGEEPFENSKGYSPCDANNSISTDRNSLMVISPDDNGPINYIRLDVSPTWLIFNTSGTKLYIATDENRVMVYDILSNNLLIGIIQTPYPPTDLKLSPDGKFLYIAYGGENGILVVDTKENLPVADIKMPPLSDGKLGIPMALACSPNGRTVYIALSASNAGEVVAFDALTMRPISKAPTGSQPVGIAISPNGNKLYVANQNSGNVSFLTTNPLALSINVSVGVSPSKLAITPDSKTVIVTCRGSNTVEILSAETGKKMGTISVGKEPMGIAVTNDGKKTYVANRGDGTVSIIDNAKNSVIRTTMPQPLSRPFGVTVKP